MQEQTMLAPYHENFLWVIICVILPQHCFSNKRGNYMVVWFSPHCVVMCGYYATMKCTFTMKARICTSREFLKCCLQLNSRNKYHYHLMHTTCSFIAKLTNCIYIWNISAVYINVQGHICVCNAHVAPVVKKKLLLTNFCTFQKMWRL